MGHTLIATCGGGRPARQYIGIAKELGAPAELQDRLGILASHSNALLLIAALGEDAYPGVNRTAGDIRRHTDEIAMSESHVHATARDEVRHIGPRVLVGGGHLPGSSTDYRAVIFAEAIGADLVVNATDVAGVYTENPKTHPEARKLNSLTYSELERIIKRNAKQSPGDYGLFDLKAMRLARRIGITIVFVDGSDPREIARALEGKHSGTVVK